VKKKAIVLAAYMAWATPTTGTAKTTSNSFSALNLGEVKSHSNLGESFKGVIPILFTSVQQAKQLKISLAPQSVFEQVGAERSAELNYLRFQIKTYKNKPYLVVRSTQPLHQPILNFILEIESSKGITYQDYTVMLDPPGTKTNIKPSASLETSKMKDVKRTSVRHKRKASSFTPSKNKSSHSNRHYVKSGDSLSKIALHYRHSGISLKKMMMGIYYANPEAFLAHDINKIKKGALLKIPSAKKIKSFSLKGRKSSALPPGKQAQKNIRHYKVKRGDTLSQITKKHLYNGVSFSRMMKSIYNANRHAFAKNNMNLLFAGEVLRIPTYTEVVNKTTAKTVAKPASASSVVDSISTQVTKQHLKQSPKRNKKSDLSRPATYTSVLARKQNKSTPNQLKPENKALDKTNTSANNDLHENLHETIRLQKRIRELRGKLSTITTKYEELTEKFDNKNSLDERKNRKNQAPIKPITSSIPSKENNNDLTSENKLSTQLFNELTLLKNSLANGDVNYTILALLLGGLLIRYRDKIYSYNSIPADVPKFYPPAEDKISEAEKELISLSEQLKKSAEDNHIKVETDKDKVEAETEIEETEAETETISVIRSESFEVDNDVANDVANDSGGKNSDEIKQTVSNNQPALFKIPLTIQQSHKAISEESIQECEMLIDELISELSNKTIKPEHNPSRKEFDSETQQQIQFLEKELLANNA